MNKPIMQATINDVTIELFESLQYQNIGGRSVYSMATTGAKGVSIRDLGDSFATALMQFHDATIALLANATVQLVKAKEEN